jgi:hypothetical protein
MTIYFYRHSHATPHQKSLLAQSLAQTPHGSGQLLNLEHGHERQFMPMLNRGRHSHEFE